MRLIKNASKEKLRGGFYTPENIASFILKWAVNGNKDYDILEPSCGDGVFIEQIKNDNFEYKTLKAIELDEDEYKKTNKINLSNFKVLNQDFLEYCNNTKDRFDLIIGNPPYIRYQYFSKEQRNQAEEIFRKADLKYSKLTNAWVSFVVGSSLLLKEKGKIAFVLPAEILQVSYAKQLRNFLAHYYNKVSIISFKKLVFPDIQQEVVLLFCQKTGSEEHLIEHIEVKDAKELEKLDLDKIKKPKKKIDFKSNKWTFYFLNQQEINFIEKYLHNNFLDKYNKSFKTLGEYAKVEVGMTTGANSFFTVDKDTLQKYNLSKYSCPMVGRSVQVNSLNFIKSDWIENVNKGAKAHFLEFPIKSKIKDKKILEYLNLGEEQEIHKGYKCSIRDEWQIVPSIRISDALFVRRNNLYPKLVLNSTKAHTTDTMHRVTIKEGIDPKALISSYYNSLSLAFSEFCGRSHGGGVLELMPSEAEDILLPYHKDNYKLFDIIDNKFREGIHIDLIINEMDKITLQERFGMSDKEVKLANQIWKKLRNRRLERGK